MVAEDYLSALEKKYCWVHPHTLLKFEVQVAEHCNLNCKNCSHYAPLAERSFLDIARYQKDCVRLSELFGAEMEQIRLVGGEPLLHPQLIDIMRITRKSFSFGRIRLVTNGVLLPNMDEEFWRACQVYNIEIAPTKYPVNFDYALWERYARSKGVSYKLYNNGEESKRMRRNLIGVQGRQYVERNYYHCVWANRCLTLRNGRLYGCEVPAHAYHLKKYFDLNIPLSERNSVDIYQVNSADELMTSINRPIPFCRFCNLNSQEFEEDWGPSRRDRYEWIDFEWTPDDIQYLKDANAVYLYGTGAYGLKAAQRLKQYGVEVCILRERSSAEYIQGFSSIEMSNLKLGNEKNICLIAISAPQTVEPILAQCGFNYIIPLYWV